MNEAGDMQFCRDCGRELVSPDPVCEGCRRVLFRQGEVVRIANVGAVEEFGTIVCSSDAKEDDIRGCHQRALVLAFSCFRGKDDNGLREVDVGLLEKQYGEDITVETESFCSHCKEVNSQCRCDGGIGDNWV